MEDKTNPFTSYQNLECQTLSVEQSRSPSSSFPLPHLKTSLFEDEYDSRPLTSVNRSNEWEPGNQVKASFPLLFSSFSSTSPNFQFPIHPLPFFPSWSPRSSPPQPETVLLLSFSCDLSPLLPASEPPHAGGNRPASGEAETGRGRAWTFFSRKK